MDDFFRVSVTGTSNSTGWMLPTSDYSDVEDKRRLIRSSDPFKGNARFCIDGDSDLQEFMKFGDSSNFAFSQRVFQHLIGGGLTGWSTYPIAISGFEYLPYYGFVLTSALAGELLNRKARNKFEERFTKFDLKCWDGSDFFSLEGTSALLCSAKAEKVLSSLGSASVKIKPVIAI